MSRRARGAIGAAITLLLLWWVLRGVSPSAVLEELRQASPWWLTVAVVLATFSFALRAMRWWVLLAPRHVGTGFDVRFGATCAGFAANNIFPARAGEFVRAYVLSRVGRVPLGASVGSLVVERVLDGLVLASFLVVPILLPGFPLAESGSGALVRRVALVGSAGFTAGFLALWLAARHPETTFRLWTRTVGRVVPDRFSGSLDRGVGTFLEGLGSLADPGLLARAVGWSYVVWMCLAASIWTGLLAFDITGPGPVGAAFVQAVIGFSVAVPSTPGFFGVFEAGARIGLQPWNVPDAVLVGFVTSYHILTFIPVTVIGLWYARHVGMRWDEVRGEARAETRREEAPGPRAGAGRSGRDGTERA